MKKEKHEKNKRRKGKMENNIPFPSIQLFSPIHKVKQKRNPLCDLTTIKNPITSLMHF